MSVTFNLLGPQGSGKGTQAEALLERFNFAHFDLGENLRRIEESGSALGRELSTYVDQGKLVPAKLIAEVTSRLIESTPNGRDILFDGLMRSLEEVEHQRPIFAKAGLSLPAIIFLNLDEETAIQRLATRRICSKCHARYTVTLGENELKVCRRCGGNLMTRHDDTPEAIAQRLQLYHAVTEPVIEYFRQHGTVIEVDASPSVEEVTADIVAKIENYYKSIGKSAPKK